MEADAIRVSGRVGALKEDNVIKDIPDADQGPLKGLAHALAELLDKVGVPTIAGHEAQRQLTEQMKDWKAGGGSAEGAGLIQKAQGIVGMVNSTTDGDPNRHHAYRNLVGYKNQLREIARAG
jgi:hypothetical protein